MLRKRTLIKLLIAVPILWIAVMLITNFSDSSSISSGELAKDKQKIERLQRENKRLIEEAALKHQEERRLRQENEANNLHELNKDDHDHPEEERLKAQEQEKAQAGPIQVHAPIDNNPNAPGELGKPVTIEKEKLSPAERIKFDDGWKNNAFNQYASDIISLHRSLADMRDPM